MPGSSSLSASTFEALVHEIAAGILGNGCRKLIVLNTGISTLAPVDRALARLDAGRTRHLWIHGGPRYPPRGQGAGRAEPWQPCRRTRNLADAGDRAASGRHGARRSEPCPQTDDAGRIDAVGPEFAELQPLRQLWRSDPGDRSQGRSLARRHARRSQRTGRLVHRGRRRHAPGWARSQACCDENHQALFAGPLPPRSSPPCWRAPSASAPTRNRNIMRGDRMPYDAFDRLPKTDLEVAGGIIHVALRARRHHAAQRKIAGLGQDVGQGRHRPITAAFPSTRCGCCWCRSMAPAFAAAPPGAIAAPPSASRLAATPPRMCCGATG